MNLKKTKEKIYFIEFAKGFAIFSIVLFHYFSPYTSGFFSKAIMYGGAGVHVFILISGFGLGLSSLRLSFKSFYIKRFTKILIPYYAAVLIIYFFNLNYGFYKENDLYALFGHILLYKMFDSTIVGSFGGQLWFISTIVQFYIFFPVIVLCKNFFSDFYFLVVSFFISVVYWVIISHFNLYSIRIYNSFFLQYLWEFCLGIYLSDLYIKKEFKFWVFNSLTTLTTLTCISLIVMAFISVNDESYKSLNDIPSLISYLGLVIICFTLIKKFNLKLIDWFFVKIGSFSYEFFLLHNFVLVMVNLFLIDFVKLYPSILSTVLVVLPISIIASYAYSKIIIYINKTIVFKVINFKELE